MTTACQPEPTDLFSTDPVAPVITAHNAVVLSEATADEIVSFNWSAARNVTGEILYSLDVAYGENTNTLADDIAGLFYSIRKADFRDWLINTAGMPENEDGSIMLTVTAATANEVLVSEPAAVEIVLTAGAQPVIPAGLWSVIGTINDSNWDSELYMTAGEDGKWISPVFSLGDGGEFKLHYNNSWDHEAGVAEASLTVGSPVAALASGGGNCKAAEGLYYVVYDSKNATITLYDGVAGAGIIGNGLPNGWDNDSYKLTATSSDVYKSYPILFSEGNTFKIRKDNAWNDDSFNWGSGIFEEYGQPFTLENSGGSSDMSADGFAGIPVVLTLNASDESLTVDRFFTTYSVIGTINGTNWNFDVAMYEVESGKWKSVPFIAGTEFKIRKDGDWAESYGAPEGVQTEFDTPIEVGDRNFYPVEEMIGKSVVVTIDLTARQTTVEEF